MSGEEKRGSQRRDFAMATEDRLEATRRVLKWLDDNALENEPQTSPAVQTPPPSSPNPSEASHRWISHSGDTPTDLVV
jgi:hypothetical protein